MYLAGVSMYIYIYFISLNMINLCLSTNPSIYLSMYPRGPRHSMYAAYADIDPPK